MTQQDESAITLVLLGYGVGGSWSLDDMIAFAGRFGFAGLDFRCAFGYQHGVEVDTSAQQRRSQRDAIESAGLRTFAIRAGSRFHFSDAGARSRQVADAKAHVDLAVDLAAAYVRVYGHDIQPGCSPADTTSWVAESMIELCDYARGAGVQILLEMAGDFGDPVICADVIAEVNRPEAGLLYNCDDRDVLDGRLTPALARVTGHIRHVDVHSWWNGYPYERMFDLLDGAGYHGAFVPELGEDSLRADELVASQAELFRHARRSHASAAGLDLTRTRGT